MPRGGNTTERGYGKPHQNERQRYARQQAAGVTLTCWRCRRPILPGQEWDLGHDDHDRSVTRGPEHRYRTRYCPGNRSSGASKGNRARGRRGKPRRTTDVPRPETASRWVRAARD